MKRTVLILSLLFTCWLQKNVSGQDIHFSQYFATPLTINPANTGFFDGDYRAGANYRQQWQSVTVPYKTFAAYGDLGLMKKIYNKYFIGVGLSIIGDRAGDGNLGVTKVMLSGAFHYSLNAQRTNYVSVGLQAGFVEERIDWNKLYFDNQWNELTFDKSLPSGEQGYTSSTGYFDVQLGGMYSFKATEKISGYVSLAVYHLLRPQVSFFDDPNDLGMRPVFSAGATIKATTLLNVYPSVNYMSQKKASEFNIGSLVSYDFLSLPVDMRRFYLGAYLRTKDAFYPVVGYEYHHIRALFSYDINYSELEPSSGGRGAWELSIVYIGSFPKTTPKIYTKPCPRF